MALVQTTYYHLECNGPAATPFQKHCTTISEGGWVQDEVEQAALAEGWGKEGRSTFCPKHYAAVSTAAATPSRRKAAPSE